MKLTKLKLKEIIREELLKEDQYEILDVADQSEELGKLFKTWAHSVSPQYDSKTNRLIGKALKEYNAYFATLKKVFKEVG
jgi:hypothetical protein